MCIAISLPAGLRHWHKKVGIPVVVESLIYDSHLRQLVVAFDCIVRNDSDEPVDVWLTHIDNVEGRLGTEDWYSLRSRNPDERSVFVASVYEGCWDFDPSSGLLRYRDPAESQSGAPGLDAHSIVARALTYREQGCTGQAMNLYRDLLNFDASPYTPADRRETAPIYRLLSFPRSVRSEAPNQRWLPYTTFRVGPIAPSSNGIATAFRLTILLSDQSYRRLIQPRDGSAFYVYSSDRICDEVEDFALPRFQRDPRCDEFRTFFDQEVRPTLITPERYQILIGQPDESTPLRKSVLVRPTSSRVCERMIVNQATRRRALWFNTWSSDFSMVLEYGDQVAARADGYRVQIQEVASIPSEPFPRSLGDGPPD